jgi:hypothetical protein
MKAHAAVAAKLLQDEALVWSVIHDLESSSIDEKEKALLLFVRKVTLAPTSLTAADTSDSTPRVGTTPQSSMLSPRAPCLTYTTVGSRLAVSVL